MIRGQECELLPRCSAQLRDRAVSVSGHLRSSDCSMVEQELKTALDVSLSGQDSVESRLFLVATGLIRICTVAQKRLCILEVRFVAVCRERGEPARHAGNIRTAVAAVAAVAESNGDFRLAQRSNPLSCAISRCASFRENRASKTARPTDPPILADDRESGVPLRRRVRRVP